MSQPLPASDAARIPPWPPAPSRAAQERILAILQSGKWGMTQGGTVNALAKRLAALHGVSHGICCANGTIAIILALKAAGVRPGDEVIVPAYTFLATVSAPLLIGAIPVFAEIEPATLLLDPASVAARLSPKTRAIIPVHLAGALADAAAMREMSAGRPIAVIEDAAQAIGARHRRGTVGKLGHMATLSFQTSKNVASGEGGAVLTDDPAFGALLWSLHNAGRVPDGLWYQHEFVGWNLRLSEVQAAIADDMVDSLPDYQALRDAGWARLTELARAEGLPVRVVAPADTLVHARHIMPWQLDTAREARSLRDAVVNAIGEAGIPVAKGYPCLNTLPAIAREIAALGGRPPDALPITESTADRTWWLPQNVLLADESVHRAIIAAMARALG